LASLEVDEARADLLLHIQLADATRDWADNDEDAAFLWSGRRLALIDNWCEHGGQPNMRETRFIYASHAHAEAQAARERQFQQLPVSVPPPGRRSSAAR
jgi:hypothetical protein